MYDLLRLLKEAIGSRPLIPLVLIVAAGLAFKTVRGYPVRELFYDRYYLLTALTIAFAAAANAVWTSGLADRTPLGRSSMSLELRVTGRIARFTPAFWKVSLQT